MAAFLLLALTAGASNPITAEAPIPVQAAVSARALPDTTPAVGVGVGVGVGIVPGNTVIILELVDSVSSKEQIRGDTFALRLAEPILAGDRVLVPVGTPAVGEVIHSQKASGGGRAGELTLAARYLETPFGRIKLRSSFGSAGQNHTKAALATSFIAGPFALMVQGSDRVLPAGTRVSSKVAADSDLAHLGEAAAAASLPASIPAVGTAARTLATPVIAPAPSISNPEGSPTQ